MSRGSSSPKCSFCGKPQSQVRRLISGSAAFICGDCVRLCGEILEDETVERPSRKSFVLPLPEEIKAALDEWVIGQDRAKKVLSVAVYNHYKRVLRRPKGVDIEKSNILLMGPTGVGKTLLAQTLARILNVPFSISDATTLTEAGYVGEDVENILVRLLQAADYDLRKAEMGIVYVDEIDKISRKSDNPSITRDVSGEGVQQALLKIVEGTTANVPPQGGRKHPEQSYVQVNTTNVLFICGGTFDGLERIVARRLGSSSLGFGTSPKLGKGRSIGEILSKTEPEDLIRYGLIPEFVGRLPTIAALHELGKDALIDILTKPKNALCKQYEKLFDLEGVKLAFTPESLDAVAEVAMKRGTGARGLRAVLEDSMLEIMYKLPSRREVGECVVSREVITEKAEPVYVLRERRKGA